MKEERCVHVGLSRSSRRRLLSVWVAVLVLAISSGVSGQEPPTNSRPQWTSLKEILNEAKTLSDEQLKLLLSYENEIQRLKRLLREQEQSYSELSRELEASETYSTQLFESFGNLRLQLETRIADLEAQLRRSEIMGWVKGLGGIGLGYGGRALQEGLR